MTWNRNNVGTMERSESGRLVVIRRGSGPRSGPPSKGAGKMRVVLNIHGGQKGLADVIEGLVERNERAILEGKAEPADIEELESRLDPQATAWRDAPQATKDDYVSSRTAAAWLAASLRTEGVPAIVGFSQGDPGVFTEDGAEIMVFRGDPRRNLSRLGATEGRSDERMLVTIDDDEALPVREINQAIARHNAVRIAEKRLPPLYESGVRYKVEGSPELWWDYEEQLAKGFDDCEGLAATRVGELLLKGYDAKVWTRLVQRPERAMGGTGKGRLFHAIVKVERDPNGNPVLGPDGVPAYDDPSVRTGMPKPQWFLDYAAERRGQGQDL